MMVRAGDATLYVEEFAGSGLPLVFVHGSWDDHTTWDGCVSRLRGRRRTVAYDRRGHSNSTAPAGQGRIGGDVDDLIAVLHHVGSPAIVVGHSYGATVCLIATLDHPELVAAAVVHEPPLFATLSGHPAHHGLLAAAAESMAAAAMLIERGDIDAGAQLFIDDVAFGHNAWTTIFDARHRAIMLANAHTWLDQYRDPDRLALDPARLAEAIRPVLITRGTHSPAIYGPSLDIVLARAPNVMSRYIVGAGHAAPLTHPAEIVALIEELDV